MDAWRGVLAAALLAAAGPGCENAGEPAAAWAAASDRASTCTSALVLMPTDPALRRAATRHAVGAGHVVTARADGLNVEITALPHSGAAAPVTVQQTEYGFDASFARDCGLYNVSLSCDRPGDRRCADERYVRQLIDGLAPG